MAWYDFGYKQLRDEVSNKVENKAEAPKTLEFKYGRDEGVQRNLPITANTPKPQETLYNQPSTQSILQKQISQAESQPRREMQIPYGKELANIGEGLGYAYSEYLGKPIVNALTTERRPEGENYRPSYPSTLNTQGQPISMSRNVPIALRNPQPQQQFNIPENQADNVRPIPKGFIEELDRTQGIVPNQQTAIGKPAQQQKQTNLVSSNIPQYNKYQSFSEKPSRAETFFPLMAEQRGVPYNPAQRQEPEMEYAGKINGIPQYRPKNLTGAINQVPEQLAIAPEERAQPYKPERKISYRDPQTGAMVEVPERETYTAQEQYQKDIQSGRVPQNISFEDYQRGMFKARQAQGREYEEPSAPVAPISQRPPQEIKYNIPREEIPEAIPPIEQQLQNVRDKIATMSREELINANPRRDFATVGANDFEIAQIVKSSRNKALQDIEAYAKEHNIPFNAGIPSQVAMVAKRMDREDEQYKTLVEQRLSLIAQRQARAERDMTRADRYLTDNQAKNIYMNEGRRSALTNALSSGKQNEDGSYTYQLPDGTQETVDENTAGAFAKLVMTQRQPKAQTQQQIESAASMVIARGDDVELKKMIKAGMNPVDGIWNLPNGRKISEEVAGYITGKEIKETPQIAEKQEKKIISTQDRISKLQKSLSDKRTRIASIEARQLQKDLSESARKVDPEYQTLEKEKQELFKQTWDMENKQIPELQEQLGNLKKKISEPSEELVSETIQTVLPQEKQPTPITLKKEPYSDIPYTQFIKDNKETFISPEGKLISKEEALQRPDEERTALSIEDTMSGNLGGDTGYAYAMRASKKLGIPIKDVTMQQVLEEYVNTPKDIKLTRASGKDKAQPDFSQYGTVFGQNPKDLSLGEQLSSSFAKGVTGSVVAPMMQFYDKLMGGDIYSKSKFYNVLFDELKAVNEATPDRGIVLNTANQVMEMIPYIGAGVAATGIGTLLGGPAGGAAAAYLYFYGNANGLLTETLKDAKLDKDTINVASGLAAIPYALVDVASFKGIVSPFLSKSAKKGLNDWFRKTLTEKIQKYAPKALTGKVATGITRAGIETGVQVTEEGAQRAIEETTLQLAQKIEDEGKGKIPKDFDFKKLTSAVIDEMKNSFLPMAATVGLTRGAGAVYKARKPQTQEEEKKQGTDLTTGKPLESPMSTTAEKPNLITEAKKEREGKELTDKEEVRSFIEGREGFKTVDEYTPEQISTLKRVIGAYNEVNRTETEQGEQPTSFEDFSSDLNINEFINKSAPEQIDILQNKIDTGTTVAQEPLVYGENVPTEQIPLQFQKKETEKQPVNFVFAKEAQAEREKEKKSILKNIQDRANRLKNLLKKEPKGSKNIPILEKQIQNLREEYKRVQTKTTIETQKVPVKAITQKYSELLPAIKTKTKEETAIEKGYKLTEQAIQKQKEEQLKRLIAKKKETEEIRKQIPITEKKPEIKTKVDVEESTISKKEEKPEKVDLGIKEKPVSKKVEYEEARKIAKADYEEELNAKKIKKKKIIPKPAFTRVSATEWIDNETNKKVEVIKAEALEKGYQLMLKKEVFKLKPKQKVNIRARGLTQEEKLMIGEKEKTFNEIKDLENWVKDYKKEHKGMLFPVEFESKPESSKVGRFNAEQGKIILNVAHINSKEQLVKLLTHEDFGHPIWRFVLKEEEKALFQKYLDDFAKESKMPVSTFEEYKQLYGGNPELMMEEVFAYWSESESFKKLTETSKFANIINKIKLWLKKTFPKIFKDITWQDTKNIISDIYAKYKKGTLSNLIEKRNKLFEVLGKEEMLAATAKIEDLGKEVYRLKDVELKHFQDESKELLAKRDLIGKEEFDKAFDNLFRKYAKLAIKPELVELKSRIENLQKRIKEYTGNKEDIMAFQQEVKEFIDNKLPKELRAYAQKEIIWGAEKATPEARQRYLERLSQSLNNVLARDKMYKQVDSIFKTMTRYVGKKAPTGREFSKLTPEAQKDLTEIKSVLQLESSKVEEELATLSRKEEPIPTKEGEEIAKDLSSDDNRRQFILSIFGSITNKSPEEVQLAYDVLNDIVTHNRNKRLLEDKQYESKIADVIKKSVSIITGGKGIATGVELKELENKQKERWNKLKKVIPTIFENNYSFELLMNTLAGRDPTQMHMDSYLDREFSNRINAGEQKRSTTFRTYADKMQDAIRKIFGNGKKLEAFRKLRDKSKIKDSKVTLLDTKRNKATLSLEQAKDFVDKYNESGKPVGEYKDMWFNPADILRLSKQVQFNESLKNTGEDFTNSFTLDYVKPSNERTQSIKMSEMEALTYWLASKQPEIYTNNMWFNGWDSKSIEELDKFISLEVKEYGRWLQKTYKELYDIVNPVHRKMFNIDMPIHEFYTPLTVRHEGKDDSFQYSTMSAESGYSATANPKFLISRVKHHREVNPIPANEIFLNHLKQAAHFTAMAEVAKDLRKVFKNEETRMAIKQNYGSEFLSILNHIVDVQTRGGQDTKGIQRGVDKLRAFITQFILSLKVSSLLKQFGAGYFAVAGEMPIADFIKYSTKTFTHPFKNWQNIKGTEFIKNRYYEGFSQDLKVALDHTKGNFSLMKGFLDNGMFPTRLGDMMASIYAYNTFFEYYKDKHRSEFKNTQELEDFAKNKAERAVSRTQQSSTPQFLGKWQTTSSMYNLMQMFQTNPRLYATNMFEAFRDALRGKPEAKQIALRKLVIYAVIVPMVFQAIGDAIKKSVDDKYKVKWEDYLVSMITAPVAGLVFFGSLANFFARKAFGLNVNDPQVIPAIANIMNGMANAGIAMLHGDFDKMWKEALKPSGAGQTIKDIFGKEILSTKKEVPIKIK